MGIASKVIDMDADHVALLAVLDDGRAYTPRELANATDVSQSTTRERLQDLALAGRVLSRRQGPHHYFQLRASSNARRGQPSEGSGHIRTGPRDPAMRAARVCYGHLAGPRGVQMYDWLINRAFVVEDDNAVTVSPRGWDFLRDFGIQRSAFDGNTRPPCKTCLDWTERRTHLGGPLAKALLDRMVERGWAERDRRSRLLTFNSVGKAAFDALIAL